MNLHALAELRRQAVLDILALVTPHFHPSRLEAPDGSSLKLWACKDKAGMPLNLADSFLPPIHAICQRGLLVPAGGMGATIRTWEQVGIEDIIRLTAWVSEHLPVVSEEPTAAAA